MSLDALFGARTALIVPDVGITVELPELTRYALYDRGSYEHAPIDPAQLGELARIASHHTGRTLAVEEARVLRLGPGDYLLAHHDRVYEGHPIEAVLDLSPAPVAGAEVHYRRRGQVFFRFPSQPGALALVERGPTVTCNHTYITKRVAGAVVIRVLARLR